MLRMKPKKLVIRITVASMAAVLAAFFLFAGIRLYHQRNYDYIRLPIVLSNEEDVVKVIRDGLTTHNRKITITFTAKGDYSRQITALADALVKKALAPTSDPKQGDYIRFQYGGYEVRYSSPRNDSGGYDYTIKILPKYYTSLAEEESVDEAVRSCLSDSVFKNAASDYEKIKAAHEYVKNTCEYDWRNSQLKHRHIKSTAYGALIRHEASCQGYSVAIYRLLRESGVDCRIITGFATSPKTGETEYHAWNLVCADGSWYNLDASWDDETDSEAYFLKSDASFSTHVRDSEYDSADFREAYPVSSADYSQ